MLICKAKGEPERTVPQVSRPKGRAGFADRSFLVIYPGASDGEAESQRLFFGEKGFNEACEAVKVNAAVLTLPIHTRIRKPKAEVMIKMRTRHENILSLFQCGHNSGPSKNQNLCPGNGNPMQSSLVVR
jgi:hypothetical protein